MKIVHLETVRLIHRTLIRPAGSLGNCGSHAGTLWGAVTVTHRQAGNTAQVRSRWNAANPALRAVSVDAPVMAGVPA